MTPFRKLLSAESATITGAALLIGASSLLSRVLGVFRERLLVGAFGVGDELDAYYAAFQAPNFLFNLLILGTLSVALIPVFAEWWERDKEEAWRIASATVNAVALVMGITSLLLIAFAPGFVRLVAPGFTAEKFSLTVSLTRIVAISPFLFAVSSVFGAVANARRHFLSTALAPVLYNLSIIIGVVFFSDMLGVASAAAGVVVGALLHACVQYFSASALGFRFRAGLDLARKGVREVRRLYIPRIFGIDISQIALLLGTIIGSTLAVGSVALFNLAMNIQTVPVGSLGIPFAIAAFPVLAASLAKGGRKEFLDTFSRTARLIVFFLLPLGAMTVVLRAHVIRLVIGTQNLSWDDTRLAAAALALFAASFFLQGLTPLLSRAFYATKDTVTPVVVSGVSVLVYIGIAEWALGMLAPGAGGGGSIRASLRLTGVPDIRMLALPFAFSVASLVQTLLLATALRSKYGPIDGMRIALSITKTGIASVAALVATRGALAVVAPYAGDATFLGILVQMLTASAAGIAAFLAAAVLLRSEEAAVFLAAIRRKAFRITKPMGIEEAAETSAR